MSDLRKRIYIRNIAVRIAECFNVDSLCVGLYSRLYFLEVMNIHKGGFNHIRKDGRIRWVDDYGHYCETKAYGGIYVVFISDITEKREQRETDKATRDAVISTLTNAYNTVWLISDVVTEKSVLYHTDLDDVHAEAIHNALSHSKYTEVRFAPASVPGLLWRPW